MEKNFGMLVVLTALVSSVAFSSGANLTQNLPVHRSKFPAGFIFGAGSSAYQSEGAAHIDGRGPSIWDTFVKEHPEKIEDKSTGDIANDFYHRYKEDIKLMKNIGLDSFRFSISWSRILPKGKINEGVNQLGLKFYNDLIDNLLANGIKPFVTLFHFDTPQALEDDYESFLSPNIVQDFVDYADLCFKTFGDRVKLWATINEPNIFVKNESNKSEPYIAVHHILLSHAAAVKLYNQKYKVIQKGEIGITVAAHWFIPKYNTRAAYFARSIAWDFFVGWIVEPLTYGDYPKRMRKLAESRLPKFNEEQSKMLKGSFDFLTVNYYTAFYVENALETNKVNHSYETDQRIIITKEKNGVPIGIPTAMHWLHIYPKGLLNVLLYIKEHYRNPPIHITENGMGDNASLPLKAALKDNTRIEYLSDHLSYILKAIKKGVHVKSYYVWSFFDDFEWYGGYKYRFGIIYVDFKNNLKRHMKASAYWFKLFLQY